MSAPVMLHVSFADGRAGLTLSSVLIRAQDGLELLPPPEGPGGHWGSPPDAFAARYSSFGLELSRFDHLELQLTLSLAESAMHGSLAVVGYADMCPSTACGNTGCAGCGPLTPIVLLELSAD